MNNITKTILSSLESYEDSFTEKTYPFLGGMRLIFKSFDLAEAVKSHLLQSQIKVVEAVIEEMRKKAKQAKIKARDHKILRDFCCGEWQALEDQISSLNETLEFLKKSL